MRLRIISTGGVELHLRIKAEHETTVRMALANLQPYDGNPDRGISARGGFTAPLVFEGDWLESGGWVSASVDNDSSTDEIRRDTAQLIVNPAATFFVQVTE